MGCGRALTPSRAAPATPLCPGCAAEQPPLPPEARVVDGIVAAAAYAGPLAGAMRRLKYGGGLSLVGPLADLVDSAVLASAPGPWDSVVPVPMPWSRRLWRGVDGARLLAAAIAARVPAATAGSRPRLETWALRHRPGRPLAQLEDPRERAAAAALAYELRAPERLRGRAVLLVDDVTTTGATLGTCRALLVRAGAARIAAIAVLRTLDERGAAPASAGERRVSPRSARFEAPA